MKLLRLVVQIVASRSRPSSRVCERRWVHGRHPDASLVNLEEVSDQGIEVNIRVGKVVKGELFPIPMILGQYKSRPRGGNEYIHLELCVKNFHRQPMLQYFLLANSLSFCLIGLLVT